jgi:outer membrane protein TolC
MMVCLFYAPVFTNITPAAAAASLPGGVFRISLSQAIKRAVSNQGNILKAKHIIDEKTALKKAAYAGLMPDIFLAGGGIWTQTRNGSPLFASANGMRELIGQVGLIIPIFDPKRYAAISLAENRLDAAGYRLRMSRLFVAARVAQYFYGLMLLRNEAGIKQKALDNAEKILTATRNGYKAGNLPRLDVVQTELMAAKLKTDLDVLKSGIKALERVFAMEIFYNSAARPKLSPLLPAGYAVFNRRLPTVNRLILNAMKKQPLIKIAEAEINSARAAVSANKAGKLPSIEGGAAYGEDTVNSVDASDLGWQFFVMLNVPVYNFGLHSDYIEAAEERLMALKSAESALKLSIKKRLAKDYGMAESAKKRLYGARILVKESGKVFKMTEEGYLAGAFNALVLQEAQNNWIKARLELAKSITGFYLTIAQLDIDMGVVPSGEGKL